ncbi:rhodanese family protein [Hafnia psychrotolerans]|uniref:Membrane protein n=1 Tax=Hafnia psychrotolerans TaxID=1477018 RepID=A0ABQ1GYP0_9GAMM|nr:rhodanese family protein [Hafnia psychrotolerans]GGA53162.1 membrane protein [Hafnia psychrotolerans]
MIPKSVTPIEAKALIELGAVLVDIREPAEFLREHIPGAISCPVSDMIAGKGIEGLSATQPVIFHCLAGSRTTQNADVLTKAARASSVLLLTGGINAWKSANLPTLEDKRQPLPIMRQVQIAAGILILIGIVLGYTLDKNFFLLSGFVGAGLLFAGLSGWCGMAILLAKMPWNRLKD